MIDNYFQALNTVDVSGHIETKGKFSYLSWAYAVAELLKRHPDATWETKRFPMNGAENVLVPYLVTPNGAFVEVSVTVNGITRSQLHPVLNNQNKPIPDPNPFDINTSIQRALVKAIALHGLGLYIYAGEDLPEDKVKGQVSGEVVNLTEIAKLVKDALQIIEDEDMDKTPADARGLYEPLTNDQRLEFQKMMKAEKTGMTRNQGPETMWGIFKKYLEIAANEEAA